MTKKDYIAIAEIIKVNTYVSDYNVLRLHPINLISDISVYLKQDNPNFDEDKFKKACGV